MKKIDRQGTLKGVYGEGKKSLLVKLSVVQFEDGGNIVCYCPALDIYGYGNNEEEAEQSLHVVMDEFFKYTLNKKTLASELEALGWTVKKEKKFTPPLFTNLLQSNTALKNLFNTNKNIRKIDAGFSIPSTC